MRNKLATTQARRAEQYHNEKTPLPARILPRQYRQASSGTGLIVYVVDTIVARGTIRRADMSFDNSAKTITTVAGNFTAAGFTADQTITVSGASEAGNNTTWVIDTVATLVLTLTTAPTDEDAGARIGIEVTAETTASNITIVAATKTMTRAAGSFVTDGWIAGMKFVLTGAGESGNNKQWTIGTVTATVITVTTEPTDETAGEEMTLAVNDGRGQYNCTQQTFGSDNAWADTSGAASVICGVEFDMVKPGHDLKAGVKLLGLGSANGNGIIPASALNIPYFITLA